MATSASVYAKTLRDLRGQALAWAAGLAAIGAVNVYGFESMQKMPSLIAFLDSLPPGIKAMVGDVRAFAMAEGFLRVKLFDPLPLLLALFAVPAAAQLLAGEMEHKSLDALLAQPITRWRVALEKQLAVMTVTVLLALAMLLGLVLGTQFADVAASRRYLVAATLSGLPLTWIFAALALLGSCAFSRARHASLLAGIVVVGSYTLDLLGITSARTTGWGFLSLFAQHKASCSLAGQLAAGPILLLLALGFALLAAALLVFERRDLKS